MAHTQTVTVYVPEQTFREAFGKLSTEERRRLSAQGYSANKGNARAQYILECALVQLARDAGHTVPSGDAVIPQLDGTVTVESPDDDGSGLFG